MQAPTHGPVPTASSATPRFPFTGFPRGWFVVALSEDLVPGAPPLALRYFGRELIAYRGTSGRAFVTGAYCPHLGAHLGHGGCVEGDTIRCPFHGWRFEGDGRCAGIPYTEHTPPRARLEAYPVREVNGAVHVFFDEAGGTPWDLPALDDDGWTPRRSVHWRALRTHPQEVFENTVDITHIGPVHDGRGARLIGPPKRDAERMVVELEFDAPGDIVGMPGTLNDVHLLVTLRGLGVVVVQTHVRNAGVRARQCIYATPIDAESIDIRGVVQVRVQDDATFTDELARLFYDAYVEDFARDFPIWENKRYLTRPAISKGDGPIGVYRHWCEQFYPVSAGERASERERRDPTKRPEEQTSAPDVPEWALRARRALVPVTTRARGWLDLVRGRAASLVNPARGSDRPEPPLSSDAHAGAADRQPDAPRSATGSATAGPPAGRAAIEPAAPPPRAGRIASAHEYFETLDRRFVPEAATGIDAVFQWELAGPGGETFHAVVHDRVIEVRPGAHAHPTVALLMAADDYVRVVNGELDGTWAFTTGRGKVRGSLSAAMKMRSLFPA